MGVRRVVRLFQLPMLCILLALCGFATNEAFAQSTGGISGRITDPQGLALQNVTVTITNPSTGETRKVPTNDAGRYQATALPPGNYTVTVERAGFRQVIFEGVILTVGGEVRRDAQLEVSAVTETVTVKSEVAVLNTTNAAVGNNMNEFTDQDAAD